MSKCLSVFKPLDQSVERFFAWSGLSFHFISHDLSAVHFMSERLMVMQRGEMVDVCEGKELFALNRHPYTKQLLALLDGD
ncbi:hypothetical protein [Desulfosporosinus shakirovi]|uniref:hypothetical protein n=1 Tax=Desulfosporosinus shakirovi TaxID=2885154 RepID=UPI001E4D377E|nr:hypothetical protein [Desulfosporosinus sp. SRJS8]MCB8816083.1 hypothetical protein [Desulfosporosinus sp. SRJS8]